MTYLILLAFFAIVLSLGAALYFMMKHDAADKSGGKKMASALALRVGVSIVLFLGILLAWKLGFIHPTGIAAGQ